MTVNEIYQGIGQAISDAIPEDWAFAVLKIERGDGMVGYTGTYTDNVGQEKELDMWTFSYNTDYVNELHAITTEGGSNRWNRLYFKLYPTGKFEMDFVWDQEREDRVKANS